MRKQSQSALRVTDLPKLQQSHAELLAALETIVKNWDTIPEDAQVPEAMNTNEDWIAARIAIQHAREFSKA